MTHYDLILPSFQEVLDILMGDNTKPLTQTLMRLLVCSVSSQNCTGNNLQYPPVSGMQRYTTKIKIERCGGAKLNSLLEKLAPMLGKVRETNELLDCMTEMIEKEYGYFWNGWSDTVACRVIHSILTRVDPDTHCPHIGPSGGGKVFNLI